MIKSPNQITCNNIYNMYSNSLLTILIKRVNLLELKFQNLGVLGFWGD